jgi:putative Se/S carrier protein
MRAEDVLITAGFHTHSGAPPPDVRTGCDLSVSVPTSEALAAERKLKEAGINVWDVIFKFSGDLPELQISKLVKKVRFSGYMMVRVGNMKLTFDRKTGVIVNISGGGCPDIPLLAVKMVGKRLDEAVAPAQIGFTLCAYTLQKAYEVAIKEWRDEL